MAESDDELVEAKRQFELCQNDPANNRDAYDADMRFVRLLEHWDPQIAKMRQDEGRPCLTIDKLGPVVRQVVNDARQNKPAIKVHPVDSGADKKTAEVLDGLIRNIEYSSNADVAYDTAVECAVGGNVGYFRINAKYAHADTFDMDLGIERIANPRCVYEDPDATAADSSDWNKAFIVTRLSKEEYESQYGDEEKIDWSADCWQGDWLNQDGVLLAEWWTRTEYEKVIVRTADGKVYDEEALSENVELAALIEAGVIQITGKRKTKCFRVTQRILSGAKVLETNDWPGQYIPIVPVYGDEFWIDGVRYLRSLVHGAIDASRMFDVMRSTSVELWGLSPKVPYLVEEGATDVDPNWNTANRVGHPFLMYAKGTNPPTRQPMDPGVATGAMNEALAASDDIKSITGLYDASLGQRSNETSGRAIMARQREGDVSTFHFIDNLRRAIRHAGRILIDLIPHYYNKERIVRVIGEDGKEDAVPVNQQFQQTDPKTGQPMTDEMGQAIMALHDLTTGKYDVTVTSGPSFTTRREEAAYSMTEALRAFPMGANVIVPELAKNLDWPGADKIAEKLEQQAAGQLPPEVAKLIEQGKAKIAQLEDENAKLKGDKALDVAELQLKVQQAETEAQAEFQIAQIRIASEERIAMAKADMEMRVDTYKARLQAQVAANRPQPQAKAA